MEDKSKDPAQMLTTLKIAAEINRLISEDIDDEAKKTELLKFSAAMFHAWNEKFGTSFQVPHVDLLNKMNEWWPLIAEHGKETFSFNWAELLVDLMGTLKKGTVMEKLVGPIKQILEKSGNIDSLDKLKSILGKDSNSTKPSADDFNIYKLGKNE